MKRSHWIFSLCVLALSVWSCTGTGAKKAKKDDIIIDTVDTARVEDGDDNYPLDRLVED